MTTYRLWWTLRRRAKDARDPQRLASILAIVAFATATAALLIVIGGIHAFDLRAGGGHGPVAEQPSPDDFTAQYPILAAVAGLLLLVPLSTLGAAAARLAVARRDARLASLRLCGATTSQVTRLTALEAASQAVIGALIGIVGYGALLPLVRLLRFQGRTFDYGELWVGVPILLGALVLVVVIALVSALVSLRRVVISPVGVASRVTPPGLKAIRVVVAVVAFIGLFIVSSVSFGSEAVAIGLLVGFLLIIFGTLNLVGPFLIQVVGRITAGSARSAATLLAGRRIVDSPKTAWRSVGGVGLATFIAGITSIFAVLDPVNGGTSAEKQYLQDLATGGIVTLAIAGILAAVSTGVMQAGRMIDQREEYRALMLAGADPRTLDKARFRETWIPLAVSVGSAALFSFAFLVLIGGSQLLIQLPVVLQFLACVGGACALILAASGVQKRLRASMAAGAFLGGDGGI